MKKKTKLLIFSFIIMGFILIFTNSCNKEKEQVPVYTIGQSYQGGYIAYIIQQGDPGYDANVKHGLIAAPYDQSTSIAWGGFLTTGATSSAIGAGNANTDSIVSHLGTGNYAAKLCYDLVVGGYSDWYMPSKDELNKLYLNRIAIGGFADSDYWCSTEINDDDAWFQSFSSGGQGCFALDKGNHYCVRAIRAF